MYLGDISSELLAGFTEDERKIVQEIAVKNRELARVIDKKDLENLGDLVADIYSVLRLVSMDPSAFESDNFWTVILNFIATRYPDVDGNLLSDKGQVWLSEYLPLFAETLNLIAPEVFDGTTIKYNGRQLVEFKEFSVDLNIQQSEETLKQRRFKNIVRDYISQHHAVLRSAVQQPTESNYRVLPVHSRGKDIQEGNMAWEMTQFLHYADHRNHVLALGFDSALKRLDSQPHHEKTERVFRVAFSNLQKRIENDFSRLEDSKFLWVKEKLVFHTGLNKSDESEIPSYQRFVDEFEAIRESVEESLSKISRLNSLMMGTEPLDVRSLESVQRVVSDVVGSEINISLKKSCMRAVRHLLGRFD